MSLSSALALTALLSSRQQVAATTATYTADAIRHGEYLVHHVAMCVQCHTPRDEQGTLITTRLLRGAPVPVKSPFRDREWATEAPNIAGLTGYTDEEEIRLLTEGVTRDGDPPRLPMPPFRLRREDAEAIVAYLRSVSGTGEAGEGR